MPRVIFITGVSGVGKTTIGKLLANSLNLPFIEGDDLHPPVNVEKMSSGQALEDEDRWPWLTAIREASKAAMNSDGAVVSCSALKDKYRTFLSEELPLPLDWVHLLLEKTSIQKRLEKREGHFMPAKLLDSQFEAFEKPSSGILIQNDSTPTDIVHRIIEKLPSAIGIIGLGVMGKSLCRNFANNGHLISMHNRELKPHEVEVAKRFKAEHPTLKYAKDFNDLDTFIQSLQSPRRILLMVSAGKAVDIIIEKVLPMLSSGDILIDAGNSHFSDTDRRSQALDKKDISFIGMGVSGGEKGALTGPAMMSGGPVDAFEIIKTDFQKIAAIDSYGQPCFAHIGKSGAGHFVKMVHNGIEYAEMQLLAELVTFLAIERSKERIAALFDEWNTGVNQSYLLEITAQILLKKEGSDYLLDKILDKAESKGTGSWSVKAAADLGIPLPMINAALTARYFSMFKTLRSKASIFGSKNDKSSISLSDERIEEAYYLARLINHQQGLHLIHAASEANNWEINLSTVCRIWTNGCIIRSALMKKLAKHKFDSPYLLLSEINDEILDSSKSLQELNIELLKNRIAAPCFSASINYFQQFTEKESSANIIQAQRDYFGAHTYRRKDKSIDQSFHTVWES